MGHPVVESEPYLQDELFPLREPVQQTGEPILTGAFRTRPGPGFWLVLYLLMANDITRFRKVLWVALFSLPLGYVAAEAGWIVAEVGRQPWAIQDLMPVGIAADESVRYA